MTMPAVPPSRGPDCAACGSPLTPGARFCHVCGASGGAARRERWVWGVTAVLVLAVVALGVVLVRGERPAPLPAMGSAAAGGADPSGLPVRAPDISAMTPREQFDRLFDRAMTAAEAGDTGMMVMMSQHGLEAYAQLDALDGDARYHAAVLLVQLGRYAPALALADSILRAEPGHLFGHLIRGTVAELTGDRAALARARADFLAAWDAEQARPRTGYLDHPTVLQEFRRAALAARGAP